MDSTTAIIAAGLIGAVLGGLIGAIIGLRNGSAGVKARELQQRLDQSERERKSYEQEVMHHFTETASRLNALTESYREVHSHLAQGAAKLCDGRGGNGALDQLARSADDALIPPSLVNVEPPRDYAPKTSPEDPGVLNEAFGLDKSDIASRTASPAGDEAGAEVVDPESGAAAPPADGADSSPEPEHAAAGSTGEEAAAAAPGEAPRDESDEAAGPDPLTTAETTESAEPEGDEAPKPARVGPVAAAESGTADNGTVPGAGDDSKEPEVADETAAPEETESGETRKTDVERAASSG